MIKCVLTQCSGDKKVKLVRREVILTIHEHAYTKNVDLGYAKRHSCILTLVNGKKVWIDGTMKDFLKLWQDANGGLDGL